MAEGDIDVKDVDASGAYHLPGVVTPPPPPTPENTFTTTHGMGGGEAAGVHDDPQTAAARVSKYESSNNPTIGVGGTDLKDAPLDANGAPIWEGKDYPTGKSHAFGLFQFEPSTWARYAGPLGIKDWRDPGAQEEVFRAAYRNEGYAPWAPYNPRLAAEIGWKGAAPSTYADDMATHARLNGTTWDDINAQMAQDTQAAKDAGHPQADIDTYLGYTGVGGLNQRLQDEMAAKPSGSSPSALSDGVVKDPQKIDYSDYATPAQAAGPITPQIAVQYAQAVNSGEVKGPTDFAKAYTDQLWQAAGFGALAADHKAKAAEDIASQLPTVPDVIDSSIYTTRDSGLPVTSENAKVARDNLTNLWSRSGVKPTDVAMSNDPILHHAVTTPGGIMQPDQQDPPKPERTFPELLGDVSVNALKSYAKWWKEGPLVQALEGKADPEEVMRNLAMGVGTDAGGGIIGATLFRRTAIPPGAIKLDQAAKAAAGPLDQALNKVVTRSKATKILIAQAVDAVDKNYKATAFQKGVYREVDWERLKDPSYVWKPDTALYLNQVKPLTDVEHAMGKEIATMLDNMGLQHEARVFSLTNVQGGYVHRVQIVDPKAGNAFEQAINAGNEARNVATGKVNTLSPYASSMQDRLKAVWEDAKGMRVHAPDADADHLFGSKDPTGNWTLRPATGEEINAYSGTVMGKGKVDFHENHLINTAVNVERLARVRDNLVLMRDQGKMLTNANLFTPKKGGFAGTFQAGPQGFQRVELPGMVGWAHPRIATVLNSFYHQSNSIIEDFVDKANHYIMTTLFMLPVYHPANMSANFVFSHGWNFINPIGFGRMLASGMRATQEVLNLGPRYIQSIQNGSGQMFPNMLPEIRNFMQAMQDKLANEIATDGTHIWKDYARGVGKGIIHISPKEIASAHMQWSHSLTWVSNDILKLTREFEHERQGLSVPDAITKAEQDMVAYRFPRAIANALHGVLVSGYKNPLLSIFGKWNYGELRGMALMVRQSVMGSPLTGRAEAISKLTWTIALGTFGWAGLDSALQNITGNPNASVASFGYSKYVHAAEDAFQGKGWWKLTGALLPLGPLVGILDQLKHGVDAFGRPIIKTAGDWVATGISVLEAAGNHIPGIEQAISAMQNSTGPEDFVKQFIGQQIGLQLKPGTPAARKQYWQNRDARTERRQIQQDNIQKGGHAITNWLTQHGQ